MNAPVENREPGAAQWSRPRSRRCGTRRMQFFGFRGFTIVEMLVIIGILAVLMAITVPALRGVQTRTRKTVESNNIRQVYLAWSLYGNANRDVALPGYLEEDVQKAWRVRYEYPVPPDPSKPADRAVPAEVAAPWTWRLFPYLDHSLETVWRYRNVPSQNWMPLVAMANDGGLDYDDITSAHELMLAVAEEPAFAYNAYHVGGWWQLQEETQTPRVMFHNAKSFTNGHPVDVVSRSIPNIRRPAHLILFTTASKFEAAGVKRAQDDQFRGSHIVSPPFLADAKHWQSPPTANSAHTERIETFVPDAHAPFPRYNQQVTHVHADGSIGADLPVMLFDMRRWIDNLIRSEDPYEPWFTH